MKVAIGLAAAVSALVLSACLGGDEDSPNLPDYVTKVLEIDRDEGSLTLQDSYYYCDGEELVHDSDSYTEYYSIEGGMLYRMWDDDPCAADVYKGSSDDIVGTWKANPPAIEVFSTSQYCEEEVAARTVTTGFSRNLSITEKISETEIVSSASGEPCVAEGEAWWMRMVMGDEEVEATSSNCNSVTLTRESDEATAKVTASVSSDSYKVTFQGGGKTCTATLPWNDGSPLDCTDGGAEAVFYSCIAESEFFGEGYDYEYLAKAGDKAARKHRLLRSLKGRR